MNLAETTSATEEQQGMDLGPTLKRHFGSAQSRPLQREIISDSLAGRDVLVLMPTGGGKSLCFQLPAVILAGVTMVISPLIALIVSSTWNRVFFFFFFNSFYLFIFSKTKLQL